MSEAVQTAAVQVPRLVLLMQQQTQAHPSTAPEIAQRSVAQHAGEDDAFLRAQTHTPSAVNALDPASHSCLPTCSSFEGAPSFIFVCLLFVLLLFASPPAPCCCCCKTDTQITHSTSLLLPSLSLLDRGVLLAET